MQDFKDHQELAHWQQCHRMMRYYLGYYGWIPAIITVGAALIDVTGRLPSLVGKVITLVVACLAFVSLRLQQPEKDPTEKTLNSMRVPSPSFPHCVWFLSKIRIRLIIRQTKQLIAKP